MALERHSIERKDFPIGRRGYEPDVVDAHLRALADEVEALKSSAGDRSETLASVASEQVRTIVEAAESSAAEIRRQAEEETRALRADARAEADATREQATAQAREYVAGVSEATSAMMQRLDAMESELGGLIESLRSGSSSVASDLQLLMGNLGEVRRSVAPQDAAAAIGIEREPDLQPRATEPQVAEPEHAVEIDEMVEIQAEIGEEAPAPSEEPPPAAAAEEIAPAAAATPGNGDDTEGARLIALNMALNGTPRDETDRYLAENFTLSDRSRLLDEVYASVEG